MRAYITPKAARDIDAIADWTLANWGEARMKTYVRNLYKRFQKLASNPALGRHCNDLREGLRCFPEKSHLVFYSVRDEGINIIAVLHQSMDVGGHL